MRKIVLNTQKITFRLTMKYTLFFCITLIVMSATTLFSVNYYIYNQSYMQVEHINKSIKHKLINKDNFNRSDLNDISYMNENIDLIIRKNEEVIFNTQEIYNMMIPIDKTKTPIKLRIDDNNLVFFNDVIENSKQEEIQIQVIKDMDNEVDFLEILFWILLIINGIAFLISIILGFVMSKRALLPIEKITNQAKNISANDLTKRIDIDGPDDEIKRLAETFNDMISRIQYSYEKQNRFTLDASHELATPLAVIKGYIDILSRWGKNDPIVLEEGIESIKKEISNMTKLLDTLLFLAKNDNDVTKIEKSKFWLNELIIEIVKENKIVHKEKKIIFDKNETVLINADKRLIKQMVRAIIDNSIKYSENDCEVVINSTVLKGKVEIMITDNGIGISKEDFSNIFDRFYRVDKARNRDIGGSGLGLSIVKWIVEIHGGKVSAESTLGKGTTIKVELPIDKDD